MRRLLALALTLGGCAAVPSTGAPVTGQWGGTHIGLTLDANGGTIEYDCASGRIAEPLVPGPGGRFSVAGTHTPGHGGPEREGEVMPTYDARFTGIVRGGTMTMSGSVENGVTLGPFTLKRGAEAGIFRCL
jgi:hypothetical protein